MTNLVLTKLVHLCSYESPPLPLPRTFQRPRAMAYELGQRSAKDSSTTKAPLCPKWPRVYRVNRCTHVPPGEGRDPWRAISVWGTHVPPGEGRDPWEPITTPPLPLPRIFGVPRAYLNAAQYDLIQRQPLKCGGRCRCHARSYANEGESSLWRGCGRGPAAPCDGDAQGPETMPQVRGSRPLPSRGPIEIRGNCRTE